MPQAIIRDKFIEQDVLSLLNTYFKNMDYMAVISLYRGFPYFMSTQAIQIITASFIKLKLYKHAVHILQKLNPLPVKSFKPILQQLSKKINSSFINNLVEKGQIQRRQQNEMDIEISEQEKKQQRNILQNSFYSSDLQLPGMPMYIIPCDWLHKWKAYIEQGKQKPPPIQANFLEYPNFPSPIGYLTYMIKYSAQQSTDFILVNKEVFKFLHKKYGGQIIKRKFVQKENRKYIQIWPMKVYIAHNGKHGDILIQNVKDLKNQIKHILKLQKLPVVYKIKMPYKEIVNCVDQNKGIEAIQIDNINNLEECQKQTGSILYVQTLNRKIKLSNSVLLGTKQIKENQDLIRHYGLDKVSTPSRSNNCGKTGLQNLGNTCFMNSSMQCLSNTYELTQYFLTNSFVKDINKYNPIGHSKYVQLEGMLALNWAVLIKDIWTGVSRAASAWNIKKQIAKVAPQFAGYAQHDSQQLLSYLIDGLHQDLNKVKVKPPIDSIQLQNISDQILSKMYWENHQKRNKSIISDIIMGQYKSRIQCPTCKKISITFDPFSTVSLPIPSTSESKGKIYLISNSSQENPSQCGISGNANDTLQAFGNKLPGVKRLIFKIKKSKIVLIAQIHQLTLQVIYQDGLSFLLYDNEQNKQDQIVKISILQKQDNMPATFERIYWFKKDVDSRDILKKLSFYTKSYADKKNITNEKVLQNLKYEWNQRERHFKVYISKHQKEYFKFTTCQSGQNLNLPKRGNNLIDCLQYFKMPQILDQNNQWYCNRCKQHKRAKKQIQIYKANKILILHLKRFKTGRVHSIGSYYFSGRTSKIESTINFPLQGLQICGNVYDLYAVSNHYGGMGGGHYTAYAMNELEKKWYQFDDSRVREISKQRICSSSSYVLFYRLQK